MMKKSIIFFLMAIMAMPMMARITMGPVLAPKSFIVNDTVVSAKKYQDFLQHACPEAYVSFKSGRTLYATGWGVFGGGIAMVAGGFTWLALGLQNPEVKDMGTASPIVVGSVTLVALGASAMIGGVVCTLVGAAREMDAVEVYEIQTARNTPATLSWKAGVNGVGLAVNF